MTECVHSGTVSDGKIVLDTCGGGGGVGCFADGQIAVLESGQEVPIESIRVGDKILTSSSQAAVPTFSPVTWIMAHKTPKEILSIVLQTKEGQQGVPCGFDSGVPVSHQLTR